MGKVWSMIYKEKEVRILLLGLDAAGKTTFLYYVKLGEVVTTIPTIGFNVETVKVNNVKMTAWDIGCRSGTRALKRHYYTNTQGIIFVIDSGDRERMSEVKDELWNDVLCHPELKDCPILIVANKQDKCDAMPIEIITEILELHKIKNRCKVFGAVATQGVGLHEGLEWLAECIATGHAVQTFQQLSQSKPSSDLTKAFYGWDYITCGLGRAKRWLWPKEIDQSNAQTS